MLQCNGQFDEFLKNILYVYVYYFRITRLPPIPNVGTSTSTRSNSLSWALENFLQENLAQAMSGGGQQGGSSGGQGQTEETAIHTPLREMGFDANLISEGKFLKKLHFYCNSIAIFFSFLLHFSSPNFESEWQ